MTCHQLRNHLDAAHHISLRGLDYRRLVAIHDREHEAVQGHYHDHDDEGDS